MFYLLALPSMFKLTLKTLVNYVHIHEHGLNDGFMLSMLAGQDLPDGTDDQPYL